MKRRCLMQQAIAPVEEEEASAEREELLTKEQVLEELQDVAEDFEETDEENGENVGGIHGFAPGSGVIEEEVIEEEEYDYTPLYAHHDEHDLDELEEETIDHNLTGTDLGEMVRDTHSISGSMSRSTRTWLPKKQRWKKRRKAKKGLIQWARMASTRRKKLPAAEGSPAPSRRTDDGRRGGRGGRHGRGAATMAVVVEAIAVAERHRK